MSQWIIEIDTVEDEELLQQVLPRFNSRFVQKVDADEPQEVVSKKEQLKDVLERIIQSGGAGESFGDPSEWQREIRSWDRVLDGREE
jgi:hypothetical protein